MEGGGCLPRPSRWSLVPSQTAGEGGGGLLGIGCSSCQSSKAAKRAAPRSESQVRHAQLTEGGDAWQNGRGRQALMHAKRLGLSDVECIGDIECALSASGCLAACWLGWLQAVSPCNTPCSSRLFRASIRSPRQLVIFECNRAGFGGCDLKLGRFLTALTRASPREERKRVGGEGELRGWMRFGALHGGSAIAPRACRRRVRMPAAAALASPSCACLHGARTSRAHPLASARAPAFLLFSSRLKCDVRCWSQSSLLLQHLLELSLSWREAARFGIFAASRSGFKWVANRLLNFDA